MAKPYPDVILFYCHQSTHHFLLFSCLTFLVIYHLSPLLEWRFHESKDLYVLLWHPQHLEEWLAHSTVCAQSLFAGMIAVTHQPPRATNLCWQGLKGEALGDNSGTLILLFPYPFSCFPAPSPSLPFLSPKL